MTLGLLFWILFLLLVIFGGFLGVCAPLQERPYYFSGYGILIVLIALLGWQVFGPIVK